jgi:flagellar biosynthesis/type III secretory pathway M-ring protein FliF/YscJ
MLGNVGRHRRWPWAILFTLFSLAFVWSFAFTGDQVGGIWSVLLIVSAVGAGIALLLLVVMFISSRRHRRAEGDEGSKSEADGHQPAEQPPGEEHAPTYEEVFGLELDLDEGSLPRAPEEDVQDLDAGVDEVVDQVDPLDADGDSQEHLRRIREEFKARAEEAALRVKQREAELHEAGSVPDPQR